MAITTYEGFIRQRSSSPMEPISVNLYRGDNGLMFTYPLDNFLCDSADTADTILNGVFDRMATLFVRYDVDKEFFESAGFPSVYKIVSGTRIYFENGRSIRIYRSSGSNYTTIEYSFNGGSLSVSYFDDNTSDSAMTATASSSVSPHMAIALLSERVYSYKSTRTRTDNGVTTKFETTVRILASPSVEWYKPKEFLPTAYNPNRGDSEYRSSGMDTVPGADIALSSGSLGSTLRFYPALPYGPVVGKCLDTMWRYDSTSQTYNAISYAESFNSAVQFLTDFWSGIGEKQYTATVTQTVGGTVTPSGFFAKANAGKAFVVKPDAHHTIKSVTGYRTDTNAKFTFEESGTDLQTGAKTYLFNMPSSNIRIAVEFASIESTIPVTVTYTGPRGRKYATSFNLTYDNPG